MFSSSSQFSGCGCGNHSMFLLFLFFSTFYECAAPLVANCQSTSKHCYDMPLTLCFAKPASTLYMDVCGRRLGAKTKTEIKLQHIHCGSSSPKRCSPVAPLLDSLIITDGNNSARSRESDSVTALRRCAHLGKYISAD